MSDQLKPWTVLDSRVLLDAGHFLRVHAQTVELPDGRRVENYYQIEQHDFVLMFAEDEQGRALMLRQYKHGPRRVSQTFPAGMISPGEEPLLAAKRELMEETGYEAADWTALGSYVVQGNQRGCTCHMFHARGARKVREPDSGDLEEMRLELLTRAELIEAAAAGDYALLPMIAILGAVLMPDLREALAKAPPRG
ncbi:NUDIX hydrolase [Azospirillum rugosum]|uniref:GDP-mannose pyrophosphatase n=1 Tax=Azospirillum rugosum TaxID=416170 RepID=A0ABS4SRE2_9PROT|nr:NUDIX hydrolase [Azospirillum rugosum]MBP2294653.1 ADP-ribose pyrophosphatase [Azospirillum rugosum]MDQ0528058.1 ADP-ribose pyrophosphatase [Azospirillum rugosum]